MTQATQPVGPKPSPTPSAKNWISNCQRIIANSGLFDREWYLATLPDLGTPPLDPIVHFLTVGIDEGRTPNSLFSIVWYFDAYPDVAASGMNPLIHYIIYGANEGRFPNPLFDSRWYLDSYPDVAASQLNPLAHFIHWGAAERRNTHRRFNTGLYAARYLASTEPSINPLAHYLTEGFAKGITPCSPEAVYTGVLLRQQQQHAIEVSEVIRHIEVMVVRPRFHVLIEGQNDGAYDRTYQSLEQQLYCDWNAVRFDRSERPTLHVDDTTNDLYMLWIHAGDVLGPRALYAFATAINRDPRTQLVYLDEDRLAEDDTYEKPFYKPDWSPDYLEAVNFVGHAACFSGEIAAKHLAVASSYYDFVLRFTEESRNHHHVREVLYHRRGTLRSEVPSEYAASIAALQGRLARTGRTGDVRSLEAEHGLYHVRSVLARTPLVSIILALSGDVWLGASHSAIFETIANAMNSIMRNSTYHDIEVISVVSAVDEPHVREAIRLLGCAIVANNGDSANRAAALNLGARAASGELVLFMSPTLRPVSEHWIEQLVGQFEKPHVGAVGARLLDHGGSTQHAGIVLNGRLPTYVRNDNIDDRNGYFGSWVVSRNCVAVSSACMMTRTSDFHALGGFDIQLGGQVFRDLDYGLKLSRLAKTSVFVPNASLILDEALTTQSASDERDADALQEKWGARVGFDPFYNDAFLTVSPPTFELSLEKLLR